MDAPKGVGIVAVVEASKGLLVLLAGLGLLALVHHNAQAVAEKLVERFHLNPASEYPKIFVHAAGTLNDSRLWYLAGCAAAYALFRFIEAYGLWKGRRWAEWMAAVSAGLYIPLEIQALAHGISWPKVTLLGLNVVVVVYMTYVLVKGAKHGRETAA